MQNSGRKLYLDIFDYGRNKICQLYDNNSNVSGQASDIFVTTERNGWKELTFTLPSTCDTENGSEPNYRLDYLKADYLIRIIDDVETDWFIISEPKVIHNAFSKNVQVTAGHIAQLLKLKNLGLEFSDDEGNNVGTAKQLLETILDGTGWTVGDVYPFAEKNGSTKYRSLKASAKTGAFKLISMMCDLFDAKPIYHGDSRTVDIVPINPFSEPNPGETPDLSLADSVVELYYGKNVSNVTRTLNTENIVTKLYAYGAYGDKTSGYCGLDECKHSEYTYTLTSALSADSIYCFTFEDDVGASLTYHFVAKNDVAAGSKLIYSTLDPCSAMYIWDDSNIAAYPVTKGTDGTAIQADLSINREVKNWFQFVMNFDYYRTIGLLTDDMIQLIADYQRTAPSKYEEVSEASIEMSNAQTELSKTIGVIDFCKLDIDRYEPLLGDGYVTLVLNKDTYSDGVIYRTDYDVSKDNRFKWIVTESLNADGDPVNPAAGVVYIVHDTNPVTWDKAYLKTVYDEDNPTAITLWATNASIEENIETDQFYLFSYNGINGYLGTLESNDESAVISLEDAVRVVTVDHPVFFTEDNILLTATDNINGYGWLWKYNSNKASSEMYFIHKDGGDTSWCQVYFQDNSPGVAISGYYWYDWRNSVLYRGESSGWKLYSTSAEKKIAAIFPTVYMFCKARDRYYQGLHQKYTYTVPAGSTLSAGNYFIENEYNSYWTFTTTEQLNGGDTLTYYYDSAWIKQIRNTIETTLKPKGYRFDNVKYHPSNILTGKGIENGNIKSSDGSLEDNTDTSKHCRSQSCISVVPSTRYVVTGSSKTLHIHFYDDKKNWLSSADATNLFTTPGDCTFIRLCVDVEANAFTEYSNVTIVANNAINTIVIEDLNYTKLNPITTSGEIIGLMSCIEKFVTQADLTYDVYYKKVKDAQAAITSLEKNMTSAIGDLYREGWWQDASYVDGDEDKLYIDALDNLNEVAKPEATYNITYLDTYDSNIDNDDFGATPETVDVKWPDLSIMSAAHLVDPDIDVNSWAFMDKIQKCYDKPWLTKIAINTNLSTIAQHSFTDVMTHIANVAGEMKGKSSYYDKTIGSAASGDSVNNLNANVNKNEKELLSTFERVEQIGDVLITHSSRIKQTEDEIISEVIRSTDRDEKMGTQIKQTAEEIRLEVERATEAEGELRASIEVNAEGITSVVEKVDDPETGLGAAHSKIQQNADSITSEVERATTKEEELAGSITTTKDELSSQITQTADQINTRVTSVETKADNAQTAADNAQNTADATNEWIETNRESIINQTPEEIKMLVKEQTQDSNGGNEFKTSSVSISADGVAINTGGTFTVKSGNFELDEDGKVFANNAIISGTLYSKNHPVLTANDIYFGTTEPTDKHMNMIWIKPGVPASSGGSSGGGSGGGDSGENAPSETYAVSTYQKYLDFSGSRAYFGGSASAAKINTTISGNGSASSSNSCEYTVSIPVYLREYMIDNSIKTGGNLVVKISNGSNTITLEKVVTVDSEGGHGGHMITLTKTSSTWIGNGSSISVVAYVESYNTAKYNRSNFLTNSGYLTVECTAT